MEPFKIKNLEELWLCKENTSFFPEFYFMTLLLVIDDIDLRIGITENGCHFFNLRKIKPHRLRKRTGHTIFVFDSLGKACLCYQPIDVLFVGMKSVKTQLIPEHIIEQQA